MDKWFDNLSQQAKNQFILSFDIQLNLESYDQSDYIHF